MRAACVAVLLLLLVAGCAHVKPAAPAPAPPSVATRQPDTPKPAAKAAAPSSPRPAPVAATAPRAVAPAPKPTVKVAPSVAKSPVVVPALDLNSLETQLKETRAIGIFTKLTLKNQVDDLLARFRAYYDGTAKFTMNELRQSFDLLMMKVLSLLQDADQKLASAIVSSREALWGLLSDAEKFATYQG